ncbi:MAG: hypothetical protein JNJ54_36630 [Myxococcaceae bacterium]|nr:hypothetical protein [Myxococcaceae bacterium]
MPGLLVVAVAWQSARLQACLIVASDGGELPVPECFNVVVHDGAAPSLVLP